MTPSESVSRRAGCGKSARPDLWGPGQLGYPTSARNANSDHRVGVGNQGFWNRLPGVTPAATAPVPVGARTVYVQPAAAPMYYRPPAYQAPMAQGTLGGLLGNLTAGTLVELVAQAIAALQSLPAAPVATKDVGTDVGNMILFQNALAQHAKRDEQLRTIGHLVAKLVG
jgi:hypothetical protein